MSKEWIIQTRKQVKKLEELKPTDRLDICNGLTECWNSIQVSQQGWATCFSNVHLLNKLPQETLIDLFERYRKATISFLDFDAAATYEILKIAPEDEEDERVGVA